MTRRILANEEREVHVAAGGVLLDGDLAVPAHARGVVLFAHGSGSSRFSTRNRHVAEMLQESGFATLLVDLLTPNEDEVDRYTAEFRFDINRLATRLVDAVEWLAVDEATTGLPISIFGASTGGGAALVAAAEVPNRVAAVVSRGGRPDLAGEALDRVEAPTLLIVGGNDATVLELNRAALVRLHGTARLEVIPGATHLFEEPGALDEVSRRAAAWFESYASRAT